MMRTGASLYKLSAAFGWLNLLFSVIGLIALLFIIPVAYGRAATTMVLLMQGIIGFALIYAAGRKLVGDVVGDRIWPASLVAWLLFAAFAVRWLLN